MPTRGFGLQRTFARAAAKREAFHFTAARRLVIADEGRQVIAVATIDCGDEAWAGQGAGSRKADAFALWGLSIGPHSTRPCPERLSVSNPPRSSKKRNPKGGAPLIAKGLPALAQHICSLADTPGRVGEGAPAPRLMHRVPWRG